MSLILGTAQLGMSYGVANKTGMPSTKEVRAILDEAAGCGITELDTAANYGESESVIGRLAAGRFSITTKLPQIEPASDAYCLVKKSIDSSLGSLQVDHIDTLLMHAPHQLDDVGGEEIWAALEDLKREGKIGRLGYSLYRPTELDILYKRFSPDAVQLPMNVFDNRFGESGWLHRLFTDAVDIYTRSVFLQGILLQPADGRHPFFDKWQEFFNALDAARQECDLSPIRYCFAWLLQQNAHGKFVVGAESASQVSEFAEAYHDSALHSGNLSMISCSDEDLLLPQNWILE